MVNNVSEYPWSSYHHNALGRDDELFSERALHARFGQTSQQRAEGYKQLFEGIDIDLHNRRITEATFRGEVFGSQHFHQQV